MKTKLLLVTIAIVTSACSNSGGSAYGTAITGHSVSANQAQGDADSSKTVDFSTCNSFSTEFGVTTPVKCSDAECTSGCAGSTDGYFCNDFQYSLLCKDVNGKTCSMSGGQGVWTSYSNGGSCF